jgi:hypothetical protein
MIAIELATQRYPIHQKIVHHSKEEKARVRMGKILQWQSSLNKFRI